MKGRGRRKNGRKSSVMRKKSPVMSGKIACERKGEREGVRENKNAQSSS